ncbi:class I SAM-dependent methyltransferase [Variovorax sp. PBL-E5]|uniref:class I SAM-dependent methyltransferase n=1 Tax=Variovorax sp. PBL-E5 TaxID=434014 RepID=UPI0013164CC6|nr:class I SAM-dependent methyltransferase [Variovorax sp. PBL-E5]VTU32925.1 Glycine/sarcosine N-methyltransferase [Variovorax sp. PBL-E5]
MDFYDGLAPFYHLIYPDWNASIRRQGEQLSQLVASEWPGTHRVLDVACGIGTQVLALAERGHAVTGADLSAGAVERAREEARLRGLAIDFRVADMREAHAAHGGGFDLLVACDNAVPHLLSDQDLLHAFRQFAACLKPGGGCLISVRDYEREARGTNLVKHYGARVENGKRHVLFQVWDFEGEHYDLGFFIVEEDLVTAQVTTRVLRSRYYAVSTTRLCELLREAGFDNVRRLDGVFYQPVLVGTKPAGASA